MTELYIPIEIECKIAGLWMSNFQTRFDSVQGSPSLAFEERRNNCIKIVTPEKECVLYGELKAKKSCGAQKKTRLDANNYGTR